jgi:hypothetical protein
MRLSPVAENCNQLEENKRLKAFKDDWWFQSTALAAPFSFAGVVVRTSILVVLFWFLSLLRGSELEEMETISSVSENLPFSYNL